MSNVLKENGPEVQKERASNYQNRSNTLFVLGLARHGKPPLAKLPAFVRGAIEVQDEGSQPLACCSTPRGEMVIDFAPAPGQDQPLAPACSTGRLYAFDVAAQLDALKPWLARSGLSNAPCCDCP